jgi:hypothetical protein
MLGLKSTGWCGLDPWLTIYSILTSFFLGRLNPYKIGPFGEPIKNGLLGRFPTLRKDDGDVKSDRPPPPPPPGPVGYVTVGGHFSAISRLRSMLKSNQKH